MKRIYYSIILIFQGLLIISTITNLIFCLISKSIAVWSLSIYNIMLPYIKFSQQGNVSDLFVLFLFLLISITLYFLSSKELLDLKNIKAPFTVLNIIWIVLSYFAIFYDLENIEALNRNTVIYGTLVLLFIPIIFMKWSEQKRNMRNNNTYIETSLPETFQLHPKSCAQIVRTAKGAPIIEIGVFLTLCYCKYLGAIDMLLFVFIYAITILFALVIFFGTIHDMKKFRKQTKEICEEKYSLKKLSLLQIISLVLFALSFCIFLI